MRPTRTDWNPRCGAEGAGAAGVGAAGDAGIGGAGDAAAPAANGAARRTAARGAEDPNASLRSMVMGAASTEKERAHHDPPFAREAHGATSSGTFPCWPRARVSENAAEALAESALRPGAPAAKTVGRAVVSGVCKSRRAAPLSLIHI